MSLILEALRKSEAERRRGLAPDVAMELPPTQVARPRMLAPWLLPALIVAALLVLAGWWARREPPTVTLPTAPTLPASTVEQATDPVPAEINAAPSVVPRPRPEPATPVLVAAPPPPPPIVQAQDAPAAPAASVSARRPLPVEPAPSRPLPPPPPTPPLASEISNDTSALPPIKLSMHIWNEVPSKRFVILNGQRMAEGDRYGEISVIAIERNGVVVESKGSRARVPLP
ncbi:MAG: general secretion pathway protein GspB [Thermomonas sp.]